MCGAAPPPSPLRPADQEVRGWRGAAGARQGAADVYRDRLALFIPKFSVFLSVGILEVVSLSCSAHLHAAGRDGTAVGVSLSALF